MGMVGSLARESLNTFRTPVPVWEVVHPALGNLILCRGMRSREIFSCCGFFNRSLNLDLARGLWSSGARDPTVLGHTR